MAKSKHYLNLLLLLLLFNNLLGAGWLQKEDAEVIEEEVYLSFRYKGVIDAIVVAYFDGERFYLPVTELFDYFAIYYELNPKSYSVSGYFIKEDVNYLLDFSRRFAMVKEEVWSLSADDFKVKELDFYLAPEVFGEVFGLFLDVDISQLTIKLETLQKLPVIRRLDRRRKKELQQMYASVDSDKVYDLLSGRQRSMADGIFVDYSISNSLAELNQSSRSTVALGGEVLYGDVQGTITTILSNTRNSMGISDVRWKFVDQSQPYFTTATLGQQNTTGLLIDVFQGVHFTNEPLVTKRSYDTYVIDGTTDPEAEVELYENDRLSDVVKADDIGYYRFLVPLNYGFSDYKIRIYAKQGRVIELNRRIQVPFTFLPKNEYRYTASWGRIASEYIPWQDQKKILNTYASMGIQSWITAGFGLEYLEQNNFDKPTFYTRVSTRLSEDILLNVDAAINNFTRLTMRGIGPNASSFFAEYAYFNQKNMYNTQGFTQKLNTSAYYPFQIVGVRFSGRGAFGWSNRPGLNELNYSLDINQFIRSLRLRYGLRETHSYSVNGHSFSSDLQLSAVYTIPRIPRFHPFIRGSYFRVDMTYNFLSGNAEDIRLQYIKQLNSRFKVQTFSSYDLQTKAVAVDIGGIWELDKTRSTLNVRQNHSTPTLKQTLRGSTVWDRNTGDILWDIRQQVGRSGVNVRMFIDENSSGTYDEGEEIIPGSALTILGNSSRQLKKAGVTRLTQLQPYRRYNFRIDEARVNNPMLVPSLKEFAVIADPNRYKWLDVPFYTTGVIDGRVDQLKQGEFVPISGLRIHIVNDKTGKDITIRTFGDGAFYSMEIPPGTYEAYVDNSQLEFLGMISSPEKLYFTIESNVDGDYVEGLDFLLK